jgi:pSer/pThr/pTyr-binding forkhead associated (FHA) protein
VSKEIHIEVPGDEGPRVFSDTVRLGRTTENDVTIDDEFISSAHLEFRSTDDGWEVVDLGSRNGTFVDGEPIRSLLLRHETLVRLGHPGGIELRVIVPGLAPRRDQTSVVPAPVLLDRYIGKSAPKDMSERTRVLRAALHEHEKKQTRRWMDRTRKLRIAVGVLLAVSIGAGALATWQASRVQAQREAATSLFHTIKALELDVRRLEATAGPDPSVRERQERLEAQYQDLLTTLGIYSDRTPEDVQLIYRTVHRLGESEATVPREFVDEVLRYIERWTEADLEAGLARASAQELAPLVSRILLEHNLPREFFYLALQESKLDTEAIGPSTRYGVPKGMWQMIPSTAEAYGLQLGPLQGERQVDPDDERHDVAKATAAAARYLSDIYETDAQASGLLVMAAYNLGEPRLLRLLRSMPESPSERNFWALLEQHRDEIPAETYDYVYRITAAAVIGANPQLFGFDFAPPLAGEAD